MNKQFVLVIEDDVRVANLISITLEVAKYKFLIAKNGEEGLLSAVTRNPDLILLDLGLPDIDGIDIIKQIRSWSSTPIIVISARGEDRDKIAALDAGADDYLTKPFSTEELWARMRVTFRRSINSSKLRDEATPLLVNGPLLIDRASNIAKIGDQELKLTHSEYKLICILAANIGKVLTHSAIATELWGSSLESDVASLRVHLTTLRRKIKLLSPDIDFIQTHVGIGYRMIRVE